MVRENRGAAAGSSTRPKATAPKAVITKASKAKAKTKSSDTTATTNPGLKGADLTRWKRLVTEKRQVLVTKFLDVPTLETLGLLRVVRQLMGRVGLTGFITHFVPTYREYTLEFLSTLQRVTSSEENGELDEEDEEDERKIRFQLNRQWYTMTYGTLREVFGITREPDGTFIPLTGSEGAVFWHAITSQVRKSKGDNSYSIPHPGLRVVHRLLSMTFFCQGEPTKINNFELSCLWAMTPQGRGIPDWVDLFVTGCIDKQNSCSGKLSMGGMITLISNFLRLRRPAHPVPGTYLYDIDCLTTCRMLHFVDRNGGPFYWCYGPQPVSYLCLPRPRGSQLPYGPTAKDFYVPPDAEFVRLLPAPEGGAASTGDNETHETIPDSSVLPDPPAGSPPASDDWLAWRASVDYTLGEQHDLLEETYDGMRRTRAISEALNSFYTTQHKDTYAPPSPTLELELHDRQAAREARRTARRGADAASISHSV